jgi:hypothetical protein
MSKVKRRCKMKKCKRCMMKKRRKPTWKKIHIREEEHLIPVRVN